MCEWSLHPIAFDCGLCQSSFRPDIDLFASRLHAKLSCLVSWFPDITIFPCDAFSLSGRDLKQCLRISAFLPQSQGTCTCKERQTKTYSIGRASLALLVLVSSSRDVVGSPDLVAQVAQSLRVVSKPSTPPPEGQTPASRLDLIRRKLTDRGVSFGSA